MIIYEEIKKLIENERKRFPITTMIWTNELKTFLDKLERILEKDKKWITNKSSGHKP